MHHLLTSRPRAKVAVLLRTRGRPLFLRRALESVAAQTFPDWAVQILEDGSPDRDTAAIFTEFQAKHPGKIHHFTVRRRTGQGLGFLLNEGLRRSRSEFVVVHDDDDTWHPDFLLRCLAEVGHHRAIVTQSMLVTEYLRGSHLEEQHRALHNPWQRHAISLARLAEGVTFPSCALMFRRSVLREIGSFCDELPHKEDWEFSLRLFARHPVRYLEEPLAHFHYRNDDFVPGPGNLVRDHGEHFAAETEVRNLLLRKDLKAGRFGLGHLVALAATRGALFREVQAVGSAIETGLRAPVPPQRKEPRRAETAALPPLEIAYSADERFALPLAVSLRSLAENHNSTRRLRVHLVDTGLSAASRERIVASLPKDASIELLWVQPAEAALEGFSLRERFSPAVFGRVLLPTLVGQDANKVLYLDADTLVLENLEPLFDVDCGSHAVMAAQDLVGWFESPATGLVGPERFGIEGRDKYFNSGVLLFNLPRWRKEKITEKILTFARDHGDTLHLGDQNPLNICLYRQVGELDFNWNFQLPDRNIREGNWAFPLAEVPAGPPRIVHFVSEEKPWLPGCDRPYAALFREYAARTAWGQA